MKLLLFVIAYVLQVSGQTVNYVVELEWTALASAPTAQYQVYRGSGACAAAGATGQVLQRLATVPATKYVDTTAKPGSWCFQIISTVSASDGPKTDQLTVVVPALKIEGFTATVKLVVTTP